MQKAQYPLLYLSAFVAGLTTLGIELATSRLLGNIYGTSDVAWAGIIAMMLTYLTIGYTLGGRWADKNPAPNAFYRLLGWGALTSALIPLSARPAMLGAGLAFAQIDVIRIGLWIAVTIFIFVIPLVLLGAVSPFVIRLAIRQVEDTGKVAGQVYALTTLGSLVGAFGTVLFLIPNLGTHYTFLLLASLLMILAVTGVMLSQKKTWWHHLWMPVALIVLWGIGRSGPIKPPPPGLELLYERETPYNLAQVVETSGGTRYLLLNEGVAVHSYYHPDYPLAFTGGVWDYFLASPYYNNPPYSPEEVEKVAIIGLAGGTIAQQYTGLYGDVQIDGIEIDPGLVDIGREYFGMTMPNLNVIVEDGRVAMRTLEDDYSLIIIDAYKVPYVPWHLTTVEFFEEMRTHLAEEGVLTLNVGRTPINRDLIDAITTTLQEVYPSVYVVDIPNTFNSLVIATNQPTSAENLTANLGNLPDGINPVLPYVIQESYNNLAPLGEPTITLTDDHAPVEGIVHKLVLEFLLAGQTNTIGKLGE